MMIIIISADKSTNLEARRLLWIRVDKNRRFIFIVNAWIVQIFFFSLYFPPGYFKLFFKFKHNYITFIIAATITEININESYKAQARFSGYSSGGLRSFFFKSLYSPFSTLAKNMNLVLSLYSTVYVTVRSLAIWQQNSFPLHTFFHFYIEGGVLKLFFLQRFGWRDRVW